jgi:L-iditol 2-dehydrogenase
VTNDAAGFESSKGSHPVPSNMKAAVYRGKGSVSIETVPVPEIKESELLVRIHACGICGTDLKKIEHGLTPPPRIFGHEIAGTVAKAGTRVRNFKPGDRVAVYHHIPCRECFFCRKGLFSQCEFYRKTGTTAGFEPAGGGFAQYVRVMDWIVAAGTVQVPHGVTFQQASFLEPLNTCLRAIEVAGLEPGEVVVIYGQGPVGLLLTQVSRLGGARVVALDLFQKRLEISRELGAEYALSPQTDDGANVIARLTNGRGADLAIVAAADPRVILAAQGAVRRGGRVLLFAQTVPGEMISVDGSRICMEEKRLIGSYSSSIGLQERSAELLFTNKINVTRLISHELPLEHLSDGIHLASHPSENSLKVVIQP